MLSCMLSCMLSRVLSCMQISKCCRVENLSKIALFWVEICPKFLFFHVLVFLFQKYSSFCGESEIFQKQNKRKENKWLKITIFWVKNLSNYVAQHNWTDFRLNLGQIFDSTILLIFCLFSFLKICSNPYSYSFSANNNIFVAHPQKIRNTICEHNCANWFFGVSFFSAFLVLGVLDVSVFWGSFSWEEWKKQKQRQISKQNNKKERRPQDANNKTT